MVEQLRKLQSFANFNDDQLAAFLTTGHELHADEGEILFLEGDTPQGLYLLMEGELTVIKQIGNRRVVLAHRQPGAFVGEISLLSGLPHTATVQAAKACRILHFKPNQFEDALDSSPMLRLMITTMVEHLRSTEALVQQNEKLSALGKLAAGLAHELNNPATASLRAAKDLRDTLPVWQSHTLKLNHLALRPDQVETLHQLRETLAARAGSAQLLEPITRSTQEETLAEWLLEHGIVDRWRLAPIFADVAATLTECEVLATEIGPTELTQVLEWLAEELTVTNLLQTIEQSTERISELVAAIKSYSYMDQSPIQRVDVHDGLESTLTILGHKLKEIRVIRDYDRDLPPITAYGSQLNQVWTNLIDNAIDAMDETGQITIQTRHQDDQIIIVIGDDGPGIPPDLTSRIFEPFFTTKDVGEGTGLGLDTVRRIIVQNHHGDIQVTSRPGDTQFRVSLPIKQAQTNSS